MRKTSNGKGFGDGKNVHREVGDFERRRMINFGLINRYCIRLGMREIEEGTG
jgi:hypothetical protein